MEKKIESSNKTIQDDRYKKNDRYKRAKFQFNWKGSTNLLYSSGSGQIDGLAILKGLFGNERAAAMITTSVDRPSMTPYDTNLPNTKSIGSFPAIFQIKYNKIKLNIKYRKCYLILWSIFKRKERLDKNSSIHNMISKKNETLKMII